MFVQFLYVKDTYNVLYEKLQEPQHQNIFQTEHLRNLQDGSPADLLWYLLGKIGSIRVA